MIWYCQCSEELIWLWRRHVADMSLTQANVGGLLQKLHVGTTQQRPRHTQIHPICINKSRHIQISPKIWVPYLQYIFCVWAKKTITLLQTLTTCRDMSSNVVLFSPPSQHGMSPCCQHEHQRVGNMPATQHDVSANQGPSRHDRKRHNLLRWGGIFIACMRTFQAVGRSPYLISRSQRNGGVKNQRPIPKNHKWLFLPVATWWDTTFPPFFHGDEIQR